MISLKKPSHPWLSFFGLSLVLVISVFAIGSAYWLFEFVRQFSDPSGANGYFYLKQTETLASGLGFYFKDRSLAFGLPVLLMKLTQDSLLAYQLSTAITWAALIYGLGFLTLNLTRSFTKLDRLLVLALLLLSAICTVQLYDFGLTFFKNIFAMMLSLWALVGLTSSENRPKLKTAFTLFFTLLAILSHKSIILIAGCFFLPWLLQKTSWRQRGILLLAVFLVLVVFLWHFENAKEYLFALLRSFNSADSWWLWARSLVSSNLEMLFSLLVTPVILAIAYYRRPRTSNTQKIFLDGATLFALISMQPFQAAGPESAAYRMILLSPLLILPVTAVCFENWTRRKYVLLFLFLPFIAQPFLATKHLDDTITPWSFIQEDVLQIKEFVTPEDHLTSHHGLEFFVDFVTGIRSRSFLSDHPEKKSFRLAFVAERWLRNSDTQAAVHEAAILEVGSEYILLPEETWQELVLKLKIPKHWKNPDTHRPPFIYE